MPDERLRRLVLQAISNELLPPALPTKTWGGFGDDHTCSVCQKPITCDELETEFIGAGSRSYYLHMQCFAAWEAIAMASRAPGLVLQHSADGGYDFAREKPVSRGPT
jgi:hypothetical protein